ncbi:MAG TPA: hypothetical protein VN823_26415 [Stellaceae bacterium]|nr:hypothetical protein [Stellaceae bacterium]
MGKLLKRFAKTSQRKKRQREATAAALELAGKPARRSASRPAKAVGRLSTIIDDAKKAGLLDGERSAHVTARTTPALLREAQRRTGITSKTVLVEVALATLALPDPVAKFMKEHRGELGRDHRLEY